MAKRRMHKCPKCERRFLMPAHLARHLSTIHKRKAKKRTTPKRKVGRPKGSVNKKLGRPKRRSVPRRQSFVDELARLLSGLRNYQAELLGVRARLESEISAVSEAMKTLGG